MSELFQLFTNLSNDIYLTENPQIALYKRIYRRHADFTCDNDNNYNNIVKYNSDDLIWDNTFLSCININGEDIIINEEGIITIII